MLGGNGSGKDNQSPGGPGVLAKLGGAGRSAARAALTKPAERLGNLLNDSAEALRQGGQPKSQAVGDQAQAQADNQQPENQQPENQQPGNEQEAQVAGGDGKGTRADRGGDDK
jgi:hypothetical protein